MTVLFNTYVFTVCKQFGIFLEGSVMNGDLGYVSGVRGGRSTHCPIDVVDEHEPMLVVSYNF